MANLLPIMHPLYNMREICKQSALLEDHLNNPRKRCEDCIRKHFLTMEALFKEAISLDTKGKWTHLTDGKADILRTLQERWMDGEPELDIAQELRQLRKGMASECFDLREMTEESRMASRVASRMSPSHICGRARHLLNI